MESDFTNHVFISYRHNNNRLDGWVTEFVENLKQELRSILKTPIVVYFDDNPQEGLSETSLVEESIDDRLDSLIFIPIVSQTYCDTSSYAWKNEFLRFNARTAKDNLGPTVKLKNGNVVSRILPVKIHDLETEDIQLLERELKGFLRSIDFIYNEKGVNRPLRAKDDELLSGKYQLLYRNQINKVAIAIKDIILAVSSAGTLIKKTSAQQKEDLQQPLIQKTVESGQMPKLFLAWTSADLKAKRDEMAVMLERAGFSVFPIVDCPSDDEKFKEVVQEQLDKADYSLHLISGEFGRRFESNDMESYPIYQFKKARQKTEGDSSSFQAFIWYLPDAMAEVKPLQETFISEIRLNISGKMMFSNASRAFQLVENMLTIVHAKKIKKSDKKEIEIFFMYCEDDAIEAGVVTDAISDEFPVEILNVLSEGKEEYKELSRKQILRSKLAVVYFKYGADWALPFTKELWKEVGGANSPTPMMLLGEDDPRSNQARKFKAPKVICSIVPRNGITAEVRNTFKSLPPV